ncbi:hypothetical protein [Hwanghaeella sp. LZ110]|uniref:hypothetical protein n=1 Tax=Hwanghaeella sp. LZ110 TaxID=3402810 RepID=UPI003B66CCBA
MGISDEAIRAREAVPEQYRPTDNAVLAQGFAESSLQADDIAIIDADGNEVMLDGVASEVQRRNAALTADGHKLNEDRMAELAGTRSGRIEITGAISREKDAAAARAENRNRTERATFMAMALAAAYAQPIALDFGNGPTDTTLGEVRDKASEMYNEAAEEYRRLKVEGASQDDIDEAKRRMDYYQDIMDTTDDVAASDKPLSDLQDVLDSNKTLATGFEKQLQANAQTQEALSDAEVAEAAAELRGELEELAAIDQDAANMESLFGDDFEVAHEHEVDAAKSGDLEPSSPDDFNLASLTPPKLPGFGM